MLSCILTSSPLWLRIYLFLWWFLLALFGLFVLHWRYELPCQDKLPEFHSTPNLGCIRVFWLVFHPLGLELDKALCGWNSVTPLCLGIEVICISLPEKVEVSVVAKYLQTPNVYSRFLQDWIFHLSS